MACTAHMLTLIHATHHINASSGQLQSEYHDPLHLLRQIRPVTTQIQPAAIQPTPAHAQAPNTAPRGHQRSFRVIRGTMFIACSSWNSSLHAYGILTAAMCSDVLSTGDTACFVCTSYHPSSPDRPSTYAVNRSDEIISRSSSRLLHTRGPRHRSSRLARRHRDADATTPRMRTNRVAQHARIRTAASGAAHGGASGVRGAQWSWVAPGTVRDEAVPLHLAEAETAVAGAALGGLARECHARPAGTRVNLVKHHVLELLVVDRAHEDVRLEGLPCTDDTDDRTGHRPPDPAQSARRPSREAWRSALRRNHRGGPHLSRDHRTSTKRDVCRHADTNSGAAPHSHPPCPLHKPRATRASSAQHGCCRLHTGGAFRQPPRSRVRTTGTTSTMPRSLYGRIPVSCISRDASRASYACRADRHARHVQVRTTGRHQAAATGRRGGAHQ